MIGEKREREKERWIASRWERINDKMNRVPGNQVGFERRLLLVLLPLARCRRFRAPRKT